MLVVSVPTERDSEIPLIIQGQGTGKPSYPGTLKYIYRDRGSYIFVVKQREYRNADTLITRARKYESILQIG